MKPQIFFKSVLLTLLVGSALVGTAAHWDISVAWAATADDEAASLEGVSIEAASWMAGAWGKGGEVIEVWMPPVNGLMVGVNRSLKQEGEPFFEFLRIEERDGGLFYIAAPRGQGETAFRLTSRTQTSVVFENPQHDFPQRITYRLEGDVLVAEAQAKRGDEWGGLTFRWQRVAGFAAATQPEEGGELEFPVEADRQP
jgi:hypothetical protein